MLIQDSIILPLYGKNKMIPMKSGLNYWNSSNKINVDTVCIPIPTVLYNHKSNFFPKNDILFNLKLPNQDILSCKISNINSNVLISNPNESLGKWLLRDVLKLAKREILTIEMLYRYGIDSVLIDKYDNLNYGLNFKQIDTYEEYVKCLKINCSNFELEDILWF